MTSAAHTSDLTSPESPAGDRPLIEIGLVVAGRLDAIDQEAIESARRSVQQALENWFPDFTWRLICVSREEMSMHPREEPVSFFAQAQTERDVHKWDFVFVITNADLVGYDRPFALASVSRTLDLAVLSTARVDPRSVDTSVDSQSRVERVAQRISVLMLRCLGHLNGLDPINERNNLMWAAGEIDELDDMADFTAQQIGEMHANLRAIADLRLEEQTDAGSRSQAAFWLQVAWMQRREILASLLESAPWRFPVRLSRLTTAAASALLVLLMTAETWDMSMSLSAASISSFLLVVIVATTGYVVARQRLLVRRQDRLITEQIAVSNITAILTVLGGLMSTLVVLFAASLALSLLLFSRPVVDGWTASVEGPITLWHYLLLCGVVSGFSLCIGALGAAFEDQSYFRHVTFVDEEL